MSTKIIKQTERGQITLPKQWRDKFDSDYFNVEIEDNCLTIRPIKNNSFPELIEKSWQEYKTGKVVEHDEIIKKYGL